MPTLHDPKANGFYEDPLSQLLKPEPRGNNPEPIAIVGMGCRLPGGITNPSQLWDFLCAKKIGFREFSDDRINIGGFYHPDYQRPGSIHTRGAYLLNEDPRLFDHTFFGITPAEVMTLDPLQRKLLEVAYEAFENAGEPWEKFSGSSTGVFIGNFNSDHSIMQMNDIDFPLPYASTGGGASSLSNRINHIFNLRGPSMTIDTACSSSMYALHCAVNAIRNQDCESAIIGGSNLIMAPEMQLLTVKLGALSPTSTCHTFDASADGYGRGEGFGVLYLKRYSNAVAGGYPIRALIRGTAVNANGRTAGISHPSIEGQESLIRQAYKNAGLSTRFTGYFECHGTGTPVGDPIEVSAIGNVFGAERKDEHLLIGSVKTNLGHAEPASGVIGVMKAVLAIEKGIIPPTVGLQNLNPNVNFEEAGVKVVTEMTPWPPNLLKRASVNSFGYGGANAHCVLDHESIGSENLGCFSDDSTDSSASSDDAPHNDLLHPAFCAEEMMRRGEKRLKNDQYPAKGVLNDPFFSVSEPTTRRLILLNFSAHDEQSLKRNVSKIREVISNFSLADLAYTLSARRSKFLHKTFAVVQSISPSQDLVETQLSIRKSFSMQPARIGFVFTGQSAQWQNMGSDLLEYAVFRASIRAQGSTLRSLSLSPSWKLEDLVSGASNLSVQEPAISQTLCTAIQIGIVDLLRSWNVIPDVTVGHSSGDIAAAYAAGYISLAESITTAYCRGNCVEKNRQEGLMLAVGLAVDSVVPLLTSFESEVKIAAINSPESVTLSGDAKRINDLHKQLQESGSFVRLLQTGGNAYHSHHMASVGKEYEILLGQAFGELIQLEELHGSTRYPPTRWVSSVTPQKTMDYTSPQPAYWRQNLESPVQFTQAIEAVVGTENSSVDILIEIGPHSALQTPLKQILAKCEANHGVKPPVYLPSLKRKEDGMLNILTLCGSLFTLNYPIDLGLVNSVDRLEKNSLRYVHGSVCTDLPTYQFNHASVMYHENRVSRDVRKRRYLRHDLLGVLQAGCAKDRPVWRNILRIKDIPWLNDHLLLPDPVLPASGYVCLAIEAAFQFLTTSNKYQKGFTFKLRNVSIKSAMLLPDDDIGIEIMLNLQASSTAANWLEFKISSVTPGDDIWTEHASGLVTQQKPPLRNIGPLNTDLDPRVIEVNQWYEKFIEIGLGYGKSFRGLSELLSDPIKNISTAKVSLNTTEGMFSGPESSYEIHPASLDLCHQLALIACHGGQTERVRHAFIPVFIDDITVWPRNFEKWGQGVAVGHLKGLRGAHANVQLFTQSGEPRLQITNLRCVSHDSGKFHPVKDGYQPSPYTRLVWKPDFSSLSLDQARVLFPSTVVDKSIQTNFDILDKISAYMIAEIEQRYPTSTCNNPNLKKFLLWIHQSASKELAYVNEARQMSAEQRLLAIENTCLTFNNLIDVKHTKFIYDNLPAILAGTITGEEIAHQAGTLSELQAASIEVAAAYPQLERLLDLAGHRDPSMKILEIGAGTGAATQVAMKTLGGETRSKRYGSYTLTDNSTSSLQILQLNFSECRSVSYKELDITQCPTRQDLERDFDLIIATKSLRTTNDIFGVLGNIRKLLKTGGRMIFLAPRRQLLIHGLALGTFTDYWGDSADREPNFPNLEEWGDMLKSAGFSGIDLELTDYSSSLGVVSTFVTTAVGNAPGARICKSDGAVYIIYYRHLQNLHTLLEIELQNNGIAPILKSLEDCDIPNDSRVIFAVDFDFSIMADGKEQDFNQVKRLVRRASTLLWLTNGGLLEGHNPKAAIATGLIRMLTTENPIANYGILHLNPEVTLSDRETAQLIIQREGFLHEGDPENELALHDNIVHISRLVLDEGLNDRYRSQNKSVSTTDAMPLYGQGPMVIDFKTPGLLTSLYFKRDESHWTALQDDWVEIRTYAIGLNWKDLAVSAGKVDMDTFSSECSGVVTKVGKLVQRFRPGDQVYSLAWAKFGTSARFPASFAQLMEKDDTFSAMASVPLVFCTAVYALNHLARLQKGEKVLIQSATGGVGLAAIQIAQNIGAEIFATVGTEEKAQYLFDEYHIPRDRILSSRDMTNLSSLVLATDSKGFDVILSSSNGEIMYESLRCIAPMGRFIDVGRVEVQNHGAMALEIFSKNAMFASFDLSLIAIQNPGFCSKLMEEVGNLLRKRSIQPIAPIKTFDISELDRALLHFSKGQHIGKIVVTYENPTSTVKMLPPPLHATFDPEAEYILAGGLGGLGRSILKWMVDRGAKNLTVLSRSSTASPEAEAMINELATQKVEVNITSCDVIVKEEVRNAMVAIRARSNQRRIRGVIHAAAIIHDRLFDTMPYAQWKRGLGAKVEGTINLHEVSLEYELPLDFFVMTSSFEAVVAMPTQAAYCAANSFQDAFARYRRARGLPACSIAFGLITEIGDFGQRAITRNMIQRHGLYPTGEIGFLRLFEAAFLEPPNNNSSWRRFDHLSESQITTCLEPSKLARMSQTENRNTAKAPRWYSDRKFCHLFQAMEDHLTVEKQPHDVKTVTPTITFAVDAAIKARNMDEGCRIVTNAIMEQTAGLLMIPFESIEPRKSVAEYGVDSLIAVELRNWFVLLFESAIPLLKLLDERVNISELGAWIVGERELKLKV